MATSEAASNNEAGTRSERYRKAKCVQYSPRVQIDEVEKGRPVNSNNRNSMFPFRRGGGKKRGKPQVAQGGGGRRQGGSGRRVPNSAAELLGTLQPTTKNLAQVLAGNTRASGQLVHARNILNQAERLVDEQAVERLPPKQREEFLEQLARLKLTLADAEAEAEADIDAAAAPAPPTSPAMSMDRLRELALSLATGGPASSEAPAGEQPPAKTPAAAEPLETGSTESRAADNGDNGDNAAVTAKPPRAKRTGTLRLKAVRHDDSEESSSRHPEAVR